MRKLVLLQGGFPLQQMTWWQQLRRRWSINWSRTKPLNGFVHHGKLNPDRDADATSRAQQLLPPAKAENCPDKIRCLIWQKRITFSWISSSYVTLSWSQFKRTQTILLKKLNTVGVCIIIKWLFFAVASVDKWFSQFWHRSRSLMLPAIGSTALVGVWRPPPAVVGYCTSPLP